MTRFNKTLNHWYEHHPALLVTDMQNDFLPGGRLGIPQADAIVPVINGLIRYFLTGGFPIYFSRDWHPRNHISFQDRGGPWPVHCVQGSAGAAFAKELVVPPEAQIIAKATNPDREAYSTFTDTPLHAKLQNAGVGCLVIAGLATDYCIKQSVLDACRLGYEVFVIADAIKGFGPQPEDIAQALAAMRQAGAKILLSAAIFGQAAATNNQARQERGQHEPS